MSVREIVEKYRVAATVAATLLVAVCAAAIFSELKGRSDFSYAGKVFYSEDDGKTWFLDDFMKGSPFDHDGKQAYRALVYRCPGGQPFVAYLAKFSDRQRARMATDSREIARPMLDTKKPGASTWVTNSTPADNPQVTCPGGAQAVLVLPSDPDAGASR